MVKGLGIYVYTLTRHLTQMSFGLEVWILQKSTLPSVINQYGGCWDSNSIHLAQKILIPLF